MNFLEKLAAFLSGESPDNPTGEFHIVFDDDDDEADEQPKQSIGTPCS